jgi:YjjG family noncanonical pyrimidine nucleotidase
MSKYSIVLFDADATLFDFKKSEHSAVIDCLNFAGLPEAEDVIKKYSEINDGYWKKLERKEVTRSELFVARWRDLIEFYGFDFDAEKIAALYPQKLAEKGFLMDGAEDICKTLCGNVRLYIVTNGFSRVQHGRFDKSPIRKYFDEMFISEEIGAEKPSLEYFEKVFSKIHDFKKEKTIIIGDSITSDIKGGINAGIDTCWFNPQKVPIPEGINITYTVSRLSELKDIII